MKRSIFINGLALAIAVAATPALAQKTERIAFAKGNDNASVRGAIPGNAYKDYLLTARAGQTLSVSLTGRASVYFNVLPPKSDGSAIYNSSTDGNDATGIRLPASGTYSIRVYAMGAAGRSAKPLNYQISVTVM